MKTGPEQLRDWMDRRGLNQSETADLLGFDQTFISQLLTDGPRRRRPGLENAVRIERVTGISIEAWLASSLDESDPVETGRTAKARKDKA